MTIRKKAQRIIIAQFRDARVLFKESRKSLIFFISIIMSGGLILHFFYMYPGTNSHPCFSESFYATFTLIFLEPVLPFPEQWYVQIFFFVTPILGLITVVDGIVRFGGALLNKQRRGQKWEIAMASTYTKHVIVCGMGKLGFRVAQELLKFNKDVVVIECNEEGYFVEKIRKLGIPIITTDARHTESLIKAGIERADVLIPCTNNELANLDIALNARELNPKIKIVVRMFDPDLARRVEKVFDIPTVFSSSALTAPIFAVAALMGSVKHSFYVGDVLLNLNEMVIEPTSRLIGFTVKDLEEGLDLSIVYYQGENVSDLHPSPGRCLNAGDKILILAELETLQYLKDLNEKPGERLTRNTMVAGKT
ncbi:MAG: potassium channel family protein [bacterium]